VRTRASTARAWRDQDLAPVTVIASALKVSRQCCYRRVPGAGPDPNASQSGAQRPGSTPTRRSRHVMAPPLPIDWQTCALGPEHLDVEVALHVLARRHVAAGYRKLTARLRRRGYRVNKKKVQRLLRVWGFTRARRRPHPKAQGRPFDITRPNELWQTDLTSVWCGEDGWGYFTAVIDCYCRTILGWTFTRRCRTPDVIVALEAAVGAAFPGLEHLDAIDGEVATRVVLRHDNGTQFTAGRYLDTARTLGVKCSRTAYRHPDGNAFIERVYKTYKEECVWPNDFENFEEALAATAVWVEDYNHERPHMSLDDRTPAETRAEALTPHNRAA
jgi:putative transposase